MEKLVPPVSSEFKRAIKVALKLVKKEIRELGRFKLQLEDILKRHQDDPLGKYERKI